MHDQLALLPTATPAVPVADPAAPGRQPAPWELDEHTRHVGKQGLAAARQALQQACAKIAA